MGGCIYGDTDKCKALVQLGMIGKCVLAKTERFVFEGIFLQTSKLGKHRVVPMVGGVLASLVPPTNTRHWYNLV